MNEELEHLYRLFDSGMPTADVLAEADRILAKADYSALLFATVGVYASNSDAYTEAVRYFEAALDLQPDNPKYHYDLAVALMRSEQHARARPALEKAVSLLPFYTYSIINLAWDYVLLEDIVAAASAFDRVSVLYAEQPYPGNVTLLHELLRAWANSGDVHALLYTSAIARWDNQDLDDGARAFAELAAALPERSPGRIIAHEHVALAAFMQDRHSDYLAGASRRRELLPCVQSLTPRAEPNVSYAGVMKDTEAYLNKAITAIDPAHDSKGNVLLKISPSPHGVRSREFSVQTDNGMYVLIPIGNRLVVTDPGGHTSEITDYTGDHASLYNL